MYLHRFLPQTWHTDFELATLTKAAFDDSSFTGGQRYFQSNERIDFAFPLEQTTAYDCVVVGTPLDNPFLGALFEHLDSRQNGVGIVRVGHEFHQPSIESDTTHVGVYIRVQLGADREEIMAADYRPLKLDKSELSRRQLKTVFLIT